MTLSKITPPGFTIDNNNYCLYQTLPYAQIYYDGWHYYVCENEGKAYYAFTENQFRRNFSEIRKVNLSFYIFVPKIPRLFFIKPIEIDGVSCMAIYYCLPDGRKLLICANEIFYTKLFVVGKEIAYSLDTDDVEGNFSYAFKTMNEILALVYIYCKHKDDKTVLGHLKEFLSNPIKPKPRYNIYAVNQPKHIEKVRELGVPIGCGVASNTVQRYISIPDILSNDSIHVNSANSSNDDHRMGSKKFKYHPVYILGTTFHIYVIDDQVGIYDASTKKIINDASLYVTRDKYRITIHENQIVVYHPNIDERDNKYIPACRIRYDSNEIKMEAYNF